MNADQTFLAEVSRMARPTLGRLVAQTDLPAISLASILRDLADARAVETDPAQLASLIDALEQGGTDPARNVTLHSVSGDVLRAPIRVTASGLWRLRGR